MCRIHVSIPLGSEFSRTVILIPKLLNSLDLLVTSTTAFPMSPVHKIFCQRASSNKIMRANIHKGNVRFHKSFNIIAHCDQTSLIQRIVHRVWSI